MKRTFSIAISLLMLLTLSAGCTSPTPDTTPGTPLPSPTESATSPPADTPSPTPQAVLPDAELKIICATFPIYDWTLQILGDAAQYMDVTLLQKGNIDLHSYTLPAGDKIKIGASDLFIHVGGESDVRWAGDAIEAATNPDLKVINLMEVLGDMAKPDEALEGPDGDDDDGHHHGHSHGHSHDNDDDEYDEHVWLSLNNASIFCAEIASVLSELDAANAGLYNENLISYVKEFQALDNKYRDAADDASAKALLFADRFPFRYLLDDYGIKYYAAFSGCSAETDISPARIVFLVEKVDEMNLKCIMVTESSDKSIAETVRRDAAGEPKILVLNAMQGNIDDGATYLSIMESNLEVLKDALS
jgi:zinc transport system substrate-binding protein